MAAIARAANFEKERKKHTRRKTIGRIVTVIAVTTIGIILYAMRFEIASQGFGVLLSDAGAVIFDNTGYPIPIESQPQQLLTVGRRTVLVTEDMLTVANTAGNRVIEERMQGKNTICVTAGRYLMTYLRGGYELWIRSGETVVFYQKFDHPIYAAALAPNGAFAVSTTAVGDQSQVMVYNRNYEQCFIWMASGRIVHSIALDDEATQLAVGGMSFEGGVLRSTFSIFSVADGQSICEVPLADELLLSMVLRENGTATVVTDRAVHSIAANGSRRGTYSYEGLPLSAFALEEERGVLLSIGDWGVAHSVDLIRLDADGKVLGTAPCNQEVQSLHFYGNELLAFVGERALRYTPEMKRADSTETPEALAATVIGNQLYYATTNQLNRATIR